MSIQLGIRVRTVWICSATGRRNPCKNVQRLQLFLSTGPLSPAALCPHWVVSFTPPGTWFPPPSFPPIEATSQLEPPKLQRAEPHSKLDPGQPHPVIIGQALPCPAMSPQGPANVSLLILRLCRKGKVADAERQTRRNEAETNVDLLPNPQRRRRLVDKKSLSRLSLQSCQ